MKKINLILITYLMVGLLVVLQVFYSSNRATDGDRLSELNARLNTLTLENEQLRADIYSRISMENIQKYAEESQMIPATVRNLSTVSVASLLAQP
jgi:hypothetical protein